MRKQHKKNYQIRPMGLILSLAIFLPFMSLSQRGLSAESTPSKEEKQANVKVLDGPLNDVVLQAMKEELNRSMQVLGEKGSPPPYFISYRVTENHLIRIFAAYGAIKERYNSKYRLLDVDTRVGSRKLDNTHRIPNDRSVSSADYPQPMDVSLDDDSEAIKTALWLQTDKSYKAAVKRLVQITANKKMSVKEEDQSDDFSLEPSQYYIGEKAVISEDIEKWEKKIREYTEVFLHHPEILSSQIELFVIAENKYLVNSEQTAMRLGRTQWRIDIYASTKAEDGMELYQNIVLDAHTPSGLPDDAGVKQKIQQIIDEINALRQAPVMEPYTGPAILSGRAAAVFFHEIFGHRIEGHRQKDESSGQTYTKKLDEQILPTFISIYDDPQLSEFQGTALIGHYPFDDEGVAAARVNLVTNGILKGFLMSRSPISGFPQSNGHGRARAGYRAVSRQGNLIVTSSQTVSWQQLRQMLIDECRSQGKPYGLLFENIQGGFTQTRRIQPQAYNVNPVLVYQVFVDGQPDRLVRGVNLIGTPLTAFSKIIACGDSPRVFNGFCGAESGSIPASCVSPPILTTQIEVQKKSKDFDKPPVLPAPPLKGENHE